VTQPRTDAAIDSHAVHSFLTDFQDSLCDSLATLDGKATFNTDTWQRPEGGGGTTRILTDGALFEKAGVGFSHVLGKQLPPSASANRPELAGRGWEGMGVSLVLHPLNPFVPTTHMNVRFFRADKEGEEPVWWFGGGFDLTPYYGFEEDCVHWHQCAKDATASYGENLYPELKSWCDKYFYLKHRDEARGIGGLFFDDFNRESFSYSFGLMKSVAIHFMKAYAPICERRRHTPFNDAHTRWQHYRRGRYVEFNLVIDRGTLFGLQSGGRTESILMSLPPRVRWDYRHEPEQGTQEAALYSDYLPAKDWLATSDSN